MEQEELLQNPYSMKLWIRYLQIKAEAPFGQRKLLFERALKALPGSYKLWCALAVPDPSRPPPPRWMP